MSLAATKLAPAYGWQNVTFVLGVGALTVSLVAGLVHAVSRQGRPPELSLDPYARGAALEARGDLSQALREYEMLLRISAGDAQPAKRLAQAAARAGDLAAEIRARRVIARLESHDSEAQIQLGAALLRANRPAHASEAAAAFRRALASQPHNAALHNNLGIALAQAGDARAAVAEFEAALALARDPALQANLEQARAQLLASSPRAEPR